VVLPGSPGRQAQKTRSIRSSNPSLHPNGRNSGPLLPGGAPGLCCLPGFGPAIPGLIFTRTRPASSGCYLRGLCKGTAHPQSPLPASTDRAGELFVYSDHVIKKTLSTCWLEVKTGSTPDKTSFNKARISQKLWMGDEVRQQPKSRIKNTLQTARRGKNRLQKIF